MNPITLALISFACIFGGAVTGMLLQKLLPEHHLKPESKDAVKLGAALIATMSALVLGILVGAAKTSFDSVNTSITQGGAKYLYLDRMLSEYGPEAQPTRDQLRSSVVHVIKRIWPEDQLDDHHGAETISISQDLESILRELRNLPASTPDQISNKNEIIKTARDLLLYRWIVLEQGQTILPAFLLGLLLFWLTTLNLTYGLFAPRNATVIAVLFACALSVAGALFVIMEMDRPLEGYIKVSSAPFHRALDYLGK